MLAALVAGPPSPLNPAIVPSAHLQTAKVLCWLMWIIRYTAETASMGARGSALIAVPLKTCEDCGGWLRGYLSCVSRLCIEARRL